MSNFKLRFCFLPCFAIHAFQDSQFSRLSRSFFSKKYIAKRSFKIMFLGDCFIAVLTRGSVFSLLFD